MHVGEPLKDPDTGHMMGYQGIYTGDRRHHAAREIPPRGC